jgi:hypothetical protein
MADLISTASLLLAVVTALMGFWYADVMRAIDEAEPRLPAERKTLRKSLARVFWGKAFPLTLGAVAIATIFAKRALSILLSSVSLISSNWQYDDMRTAFVVTELLMLLLAGVTLRISWILGSKIIRLEVKK